MCRGLNCVIVFLIAVQSIYVLFFYAFYYVTFNVIDDVLGLFVVTLVWVPHIPGGIGTRVASLIWDFIFIASVYVRGCILITSRYGCGPVNGDRLGDFSFPDGHRFCSFRQQIFRTLGLRLNH